MLVEIKKGTNVPTDEEVIAVSGSSVMIGFLEWQPHRNQWWCLSFERDHHNPLIMPNVSHYVTTKNLLKTR